MDKVNFFDTFSQTPWYSWVVAIIILAATLERFLGTEKHNSEPPFVPTPVPYFGHLFGLSSYQAAYYTKIGKQYGLKIFSLAMPGGRIYIMNSPEFISAMQKQPRVISFWFIQASLTKNLGGISNEANSILLENARGDKGDNSLVVDGMKSTHQAMVGKHLEAMTVAAIQRARQEINETKGSDKVLLWDWAQHVFSLAVSASVYGPNNPYEDEHLQYSLNKFGDHTQTFLSGLPTWMFARKAYNAREDIVRSFQRYFEQGSEVTASELVKARAKILREYGVPEADIARFEAVNGFGILLNLLPTAFWTIYHVFSDPELLRTIREEAEAAGFSADADYLPNTPEALAKLDKLPILASTMKEALRIHSSGTAARMVMDDHMLDGKYLLKRDSYIFISTKSVHFDKVVCGDSVNTFIPNRFNKSNGEKVHAAAFRGFGGGVNLCPGRAFSTMLITAVTASLVLRFDLKPEGRIRNDPGHDESSMVITLARPSREASVTFVPRASST